MNNSKFAKIKKKIVDSTPQIVATALSAAAATAYVFYLKEVSEKSDRFKAGGQTILTLHDDDLQLMTEEDAYPVFNINGHAFQVHYEAASC
jgi:hypothetical protein